MISIIPVLDLMHGQVVQAVKGERVHYRPLTSVLASHPDAARVAQAMLTVTRSDTIYVADLDAIMGQAGDGSAVRDLASSLSGDIWVDAGASDPDAAVQVLAQGVSHVIIGSETLTHERMLSALAGRIPANQMVFSLDLRHGSVLSRAATLSSMQPLDVLALIADLGWDRVILLTLDRVGTGDGPCSTLLAEARQRFPSLYLVAGGGIRNVNDLQHLNSMGIDAALVATALHRGWITQEQIQQLGRHN